jgi:hypothetical protein
MFPTDSPVNGCEEWSPKVVGIDSAERTAGKDIAKLNSTRRR